MDGWCGHFAELGIPVSSQGPFHQSLSVGLFPGSAAPVSLSPLGNEAHETSFPTSQASPPMQRAYSFLNPDAKSAPGQGQH